VTGTSPRWCARDTWLLIAVLGVALTVRVIYVLQLRACPYFDQETMDAGYHDAWARAIARGESFQDGPYFRAPLYPWFLGVVYQVTNVNYLAVRLIQAVIGSLSCGLVYFIGRRIMCRVAAFAAGLACALYWTIVYFDAELLIPVVATFLNLLLILSLLRAYERRTLMRCGMAGLLLGLSALARPNVLLFAPFVVIWLALSRSDDATAPSERRIRAGRSSWLAAGVFVAAMFAPIVPVTIRNRVQGDWVLISSQAGVNFFIGNNQAADGMRVHVPGLRSSIREIYDGTQRVASQDAGRELSPSQVSSHYFGKALTWMRSNVADAARLMGRKLRYFWSRSEILNNKDIHFLTDRYTPIVKLLPVGFWLVGPLGLMGLAASIVSTDRWRLFGLWGFVLVYMVSVVLFFVTARFRLPVLPVLALLGAFGVQFVWIAIRESHWKRAVGVGAVLIPAILVVAQPAQDRNPTTRAEVALVDLSKALYKKGRSDEAIALLTEATDVNPNYAEALYSLGVAYGDSERWQDAENAYLRAIEADRKHVSAHNNLGRLYLDQQQYDKAIPLLARAVKLDDRHAGARFNLGKALQAAGRTDEAIVMYREGLALQPRRADIVARVAEGYAQLGDWDQCVRAAEQGIEIAARAGQKRLVGGLSRRLEMWRRHQPYVAPSTEDQ